MTSINCCEEQVACVDQADDEFKRDIEQDNDKKLSLDELDCDDKTDDTALELSLDESFVSLNSTIEEADAKILNSSLASQIASHLSFCSTVAIPTKILLNLN